MKNEEFVDSLSRRICNPKPFANDADYKSANRITPDYKSGVTKILHS